MFRIDRPLFQCLHLWIKDTSISLNNTDSLVEGLESILSPFVIRNNSGQIELQILGMKICRKAIANALALTSWNLNSVSCGCQIA
jgi:hypothetical protein